MVQKSLLADVSISPQKEVRGLQRLSSLNYKMYENGIDVWQDVWRCTHAKLAPLTPYPLARDRHKGPALGHENGIVDHFRTGRCRKYSLYQ